MARAVGTHLAYMVFGGGACPSTEYAGPSHGFHLVESPDYDGLIGAYRWFANDPMYIPRDATDPWAKKVADRVGEPLEKVKTLLSTSIEKGRIQYPVRNLRFNQSVLAMLAPWNVEAIGRSQRMAPYMVPPLRLSSFTFTSISDAI